VNYGPSSKPAPTRNSLIEDQATVAILACFSS